MNNSVIILMSMLFIVSINLYAGLNETQNKEFAVIGVKELIPNEGLWVDDEDGDTNTNLYILLKSPSGDITVKATSTPQLLENELPSGWTMSGGNGTGKLERKIDKTASGTTTITCACGTSKKTITFQVFDVRVMSVGFTADHDIVKWPSGASIGKDASGNDVPIWTTSGTNDPVCYTKSTPCSFFASFLVTPSAIKEIKNISVKATANATPIGTMTGAIIKSAAIEDYVNNDGDVDNIGGTAVVPGAHSVDKIMTPITFELSVDNGTSWRECGTASVTFYIVENTPLETPTYDLALNKACGYVAGASNSAARIRDGIHTEIPYNPADGHIESNPLSMYGGGGHVCADFANIMAYLARSVGLNASTELWWGGIQWSGYNAWVYEYLGFYATLENVMPGGHTFSYHAVANVSGTVHDAALNVTGVTASAIHRGKSIEWLDLQTISLPNATKGAAYSYSLPRNGVAVGVKNKSAGSQISSSDFQFALIDGNSPGGKADVSWSITSGSIPPGMLFDNTTGTLSGTATTSGNWSFTVKTSDPALVSWSDIQNYSITVVNP